MIELIIYKDRGYRCSFNTKRVNFNPTARYDGSVFEYRGFYKFSQGYKQKNQDHEFIGDIL